MDVLLLVMIIVLSIVILLVSVYVVAYFICPDDSKLGSSVIYKIASVLGLSIGLAQVLLLPLDVANSREGGLRMDIFWMIVHIAIAVFVFGIIPLLNAFYEADTDWSCWIKLRNSFGYFLLKLLFFIIIFFGTYFFLNHALIPTKAIDCTISIGSLIDSNVAINVVEKCLEKDTLIDITVSAPIYIIGILSFISNFMFVLFGGIGLFAFPLDLINSFRSRPKRLDPILLEELKRNIRDEIIELKEMGKELKKLENNEVMTQSYFSHDRKQFGILLKRMKIGVSIVESKYEYINIQSILSGFNALKYIMCLLGGIIFLIITLLWIIHILLYVIIKPQGQPVHTFINFILLYLTDHYASFISVGIFGFLCFYLLLCTMKGNFKFGFRFFFFGQIHPMKKDDTYMNSILFNIGLLMLTSVSINQFCVKAFSEYASMTDIDIIFSTQIKYLKFFVYFYNYNVFEYALFIFMVISLVYFLAEPSDANTIQKIIDRQLKGKENRKNTIRETLIECKMKE